MKIFEIVSSKIVRTKYLRQSQIHFPVAVYRERPGNMKICGRISARAIPTRGERVVTGNARFSTPETGSCPAAAESGLT
jgi:hypothetical protein